jgi:hypothetical protein
LVERGISALVMAEGQNLNFAIPVEKGKRHAEHHAIIN